MSTRPITYLALATVFSTTGVRAADWGYDDVKKQQSEAKSTDAQPLKAQPAQSLFARPPAKSAPVAKKATPTHASNKPQKKAPAQISGDSACAITDWLDLYNLASKQPLSDEQKERLSKTLQHKLDSGGRADVMSILSFWPASEKKIASSEEQKEAFSALFRALLRFQSKSKDLSADDKEILPEVLGPERVAVPGDPPLTEEACDAYADMACFMYEQKHPGKSVDATDNRAIFASVISQKYSKAPTAAAKKAVANFALSWAKFRIAWNEAGDQEKSGLLASLEAGTKPEAANTDSLVDTILRTGPWSHAHIEVKMQNRSEDE